MVAAVHDSFAVLALSVVLCAAAWSDWRVRKIPNVLIVVGTVLAFAAAGVARGGDGLLDCAAGLGVGFALMLPGFLLGFTGAGDVKLLAVVGAFLGPTTVLQVFAATVLVGATLVVALRFFQSRDSSEPSSFRRYAYMLQTFWVTRKFVYVKPPASSVLSLRLPQAPIMTAAVAIVLLLSLTGS